MHAMHTLNDKQRQAAEFMFGKACVTAIPGSGKTLTMTTRIGHLVQNGIPPGKILGLTFTRNAAKAMKDKLRYVLNGQASDVNLSTMHAFCHRLIKAEGRTFEMVFGKRQTQLIRNVIKKRWIKDVTVGEALREIGMAKNHLISPEQFRSMNEGVEFLQGIADVYDGYEEEKSVKLLLDFSDLLLEAYNRFNRSDGAKWRLRG
jgi:DNA helicase II / ATP-dependent DNA helicase PcrA